MKNAENNPNFKNNELIENLYIEYRASMYRIAFGILRNHEDAEDAVQNAFVAIVKTVSKSEKHIFRKSKKSGTQNCSEQSKRYLPPQISHTTCLCS